VGIGRDADGPPAADAADVLIADHQTALSFLANAGTGKARESQRAKVMVITQTEREWEVRQAINAGVYGYLLQGCAPGELFDAVHALGRGQRYLSQGVSECISNCMTREDLTRRESEVLRLLTAGSCNKSIARNLGIAVGTVKVHIKSILEKLDATTRTHAVVVATQRGLVCESAEHGMNLHSHTAM
jgi:two-component system NarL family response regulator